ncbi:MAG: restriction endonuclease [Ignavibacteriales bacterium]|nr:restriction endonuclease [Ignavibacteriales bacterium]
MNKLYLGDCLYVLRESVPDESVDLVYIDPPFNSKRDYNMFFDDKEIQSQRTAFEDTWTLKNIQDSLQELHTLEHENLWALLIVYQKVAPHAFPYLTMMSLRLLELHRILKPTGSFYLHCDPTMSHYLKTVCDLIFSTENFKAEISWRRSNPKGHAFTRYASCHDVIFFYSKNHQLMKWNSIYKDYDQDKAEQQYSLIDEDGRRYQLTSLLNPNPDRPNLTYKFKGVTKVWRWTKERMMDEDAKGRIIVPKGGKGIPRYKRYLDEQEGIPIDDFWEDIKFVSGNESLGYPTQKPKALLERIIKASSNEGDVMLDAFCGCGTTIDAAEGLHRKWIGIDISPIAVSLIKRRLQSTFKKSLSEFEIRGIPVDEQSAIKLAKENPFAFQDWWITEFEAFSSTFGTKGADKGVDGIALYALDNKGTTLRAAFQVKGGENVQSKDIDALLGAMQKHKCEMGVFLCAAEPTKPMLDTTAKSGFVKVPGFEYPKLQIITLKDYFKNKRPKLPTVNITFKAAQHTGKKSKGQITLDV